MKRSGFQRLAFTGANDRGVALIIVLWIFIFLSVAAYDFSISVREEGMVARRYVEETEGYYLALAGFEDRLHRLLLERASPEEAEPVKGSPDQDGSVQFGEWYEAALGSGFYRVRVVDEGGKINLNFADENALRSVFTNLGIDESRRDILVDSIMDWRDEDELHRINGAEDDYYLSLSPPYTARNGPFESTEDLLWVRGVTPELYYGLEENGVVRPALRDIFTVETRGNRVNLRTASAEVCQALVGGPQEDCENFVEQRKTLSEKTLSDLLGLLNLGADEPRPTGFVFTNPSVVTIEAQGYRSNGSIPASLKGVVRLVDRGRGFELVRWVDRDPWMTTGGTG